MNTQTEHGRSAVPGASIGASTHLRTPEQRKRTHLAEAIAEASSAATVLFFLDAHILGGSTRDAVRVDLDGQDAIGAVAHLLKRAISRVEEADDELFAELAR